MRPDFYLPAPAAASQELPKGVELDLLRIQLEQAFRGEAQSGRDLVDPSRLCLELFAKGFSPATAQWLLRESRVAACVQLIRPL